MPDLIKWNENYLTSTGLTLPDDITFEEWLDIAPKLRFLNSAMMWIWGDYIKFGERKYGEMYSQALEESDYAYNSLAIAKYVCEKFDSNQRFENLPFSFHQMVVNLDKDIAIKLLHECEKNKWTQRELKAATREYKKQLAIQEAGELPRGIYRIIYADPPWEYNDKQEIDSLGGASKHYPTMVIEELCDMPLPNIADNAVLFIWTTSPLLEDSFKVINAWGFRYKTSFIWDKVKHNMGHYNSVRHELLLVCTRGDCTPDNRKLFDSVQTVERTDKHSEKPYTFRNIIETLYTHGKRIELFSRTKHDGWDGFGNEL